MNVEHLARMFELMQRPWLGHLVDVNTIALSTHGPGTPATSLSNDDITTAATFSFASFINTNIHSPAIASFRYFIL